MRALLVAALLMLAGTTYAQAQGFTGPQPLGSSATNPLYVTGGTSSGAGSNAGNPLYVTGGSGVPGGPGADASGAQPAVGTVLATFTVTNAGSYYVQNQSAVTLSVVFDDGAGGTTSTQLLGPGAGVGAQGGDTAPPMAWFTGRIRVTGTAGSQFFARHN